MSLAYRSEYEHMICAKLAEREAAHELASPWLPQLEGVRRARLARTVAGGFGVAGAAGMALAAAFGSGTEPTMFLIGSVLGMAAVWCVARIVLRLAARPASTAYAPPALSGDLKADLARLDADDGLRRLRTRLARTDGIDLELFAVAVCLLTPLALHGLIGLALDTTMRDYTRWIQISLAIVGHAHIVLAVLTALYVRRLRNPPPEHLFKSPSGWGHAFGWTLAATCIPGILFFAVPPIISIFTGLLFIPALFAFLKSRFESERTLLALAMSDATPMPEIRVAETAFAAAVDDAVEGFDQSAQARPSAGASP